MSEDLWRDFAGWSIAFDRTAFYLPSFDPQGWDWERFHARGLALAIRLKQEVGDAYRVVYQKPSEDPDHMTDERLEIQTDGSSVKIPSWRTR